MEILFIFLYSLKDSNCRKTIFNRRNNAHDRFFQKFFFSSFHLHNLILRLIQWFIHKDLEEYLYTLAGGTLESFYPRPCTLHKAQSKFYPAHIHIYWTMEHRD